MANKVVRAFALFTVVLLSGFFAHAQGQFTLLIGGSGGAPLPLVNYNDTWHYHKGTNAVQTGWRTNSDATLDATWLTGVGGFGYSQDYAPETSKCATVLFDMPTVGYTTLFTRKSFNIANAIDPGRHFTLTMDWDDGFVAYLDGTELARTNAAGAVGTEPANTASATASHESSNGNPNNSPLPPVTYDLGPVGSRLDPGPHVLAVVGLNRPGGSTDFVLISDLAVAGGIANNGIYALTTSNSIVLSGSNTISGSTRVTVNGVDATFNAGAGTWSKTQPLNPGWNHLFIAALDGSGAILSNLTQDVVYEVAALNVSGSIASNTSWTNRNQVIHVTGEVVVASGVTLKIGPGVVVILSPDTSIVATNAGTVNVSGSEAARAVFLPATSAAWGGLVANGAGATMTIRQAEIVSGQVRALNGGTTLLEDSLSRDFVAGSREIVAAVNGAGMTLRRVHLSHFTEVDGQETPFLVEDSLIENFVVDGVDIKSTNNLPLIVRRTTLRHGDPSNNNADAVDFGPGPGVVENCLIHDFPDKGVSIGGASGTRVENSLIYRCGIGISAYSSSNCVFNYTTVSGCSNGVFLRNNPNPAFAAGTNLIVWGNTNNLIVTNTSTLDLVFSDVEGTNYPGTGNISADPLFVNPALGDFRLSNGSPAKGTGFGGTDMGVQFPVGGIPSAPRNLAANAPPGSGVVQLFWLDDAENEAGFVIERSTDGASWQVLPTSLGANSTALNDPSALADQLYFYRARATNSSGVSEFSNIASAIRTTPMTFVGGTLSSNTTWTLAMSPIIVLSNLTVPPNITLTVEAGVIVKLTNNVSILAQAGGAIRIEGTEENRVVLQRWNGTNNWAELRADGTNASLVIRFANISGGQTTVYFGASALIEDTYFHDFFQQGATTTFNQPIVLTQFAAPCTVRRCFLRNYYETLWRHGLNTIEDCLFEDTVGDALDFDAALPGSVIRRCTFRHGVRGNVDAVDIGNDGATTSSGVLIDSCLMYDFPFDKGISIGEAATNTVVTNCLIHHCNWGIGVKDMCTAGLFNNTVAACETGFRMYNKIAGQGSGHVTNSFNNILWDNTNSIAVLDGGSIVVSYSDVQGTNWPGPGNINSDPLFLNVPLADYRVPLNGPTRGTGNNGEDMGPHFPVGSIMAPSHPSILSISSSNGVVTLRFWADFEKTYTAQRRDAVSGGPWTGVATVALDTHPRVVTVTDSPPGGTAFYRLVIP